MNDIIKDPNYLAYQFNFDTETVDFMKISRAEIRQATGLKRQWIDPDRAFVSVTLQDILSEQSSEQVSSALPAPKFIFHTAYCASTYLSRRLEVDGLTVSLREPQLLLDVANAKRIQWRSAKSNAGYKELMQACLLLFQKHALHEEQLIIKPINSVNNIADELIELTDTKALVMFTDAQNFLYSCVKKGEDSRQTIRAMFDLLRCDFPHLENLRISDAIHMSDLKVMLSLWRLQIQQVSTMLQKTSNANRMASLYAEDLIQSPNAMLFAASEHLELNIPQNQLDDILSNENSKRDAKNLDQKFSVEKRAETYAQLKNIFGIDIDNGLAWMRANNPGTEIIPRLANALLK